MQLSLSDRLLRRELGAPYHHASTNGMSSRHTSPRGLYGDKRWVNDLDIVNELGGHMGCVNALSWSKSGRLLASGSDDTHLNIHAYQPDNSDVPFLLSTTIATGHSANIFSVKFMPHSNDNTLISCAGDHQVRVFDIEHSIRTGSTSHVTPSSARHHSGINLDELYRGVQFLGPSGTNARVYRSHGDRCKRIVTESSPHLFLTCSEDGEVRQWDLRQPSSAYPAPRPMRRGYTSHHSPVPPPLISYKKFRLELNTISCSGSQPHYIVLGGSHLHAFLHDRRMLGRDTAAERGSAADFAMSNEADDELMDKATQCVRRFAPNGKKKMSRTDNGHITACKISDANPNEMIGSWSGDHIYAFNLIASPDAREAEAEGSSGIKVSERSERIGTNEKKRKRQQAPDVQTSSDSVEGLERGSARARSSSANPENNVALRVRYGNGQSEDIPLAPSPDALEEAQEAVMSGPQRRSKDISKGVSKIRQLLFSPDLPEQPEAHPDEPSQYVASFCDVLGRASTLLPEMEAISSSWSYPMNPDEETVALQNTMRRNRAASCRFVQAAGTIARVLGGTVHSLAQTESQIPVSRFAAVYNANTSNPGPVPAYGSTYQRFCYLFLATILSWLDGGLPGLLAWYKPTASQPGYFSVTESDGEAAIEEKIMPGLLALAGAQERAIVNVDASRFENDRSRIIFSKGVDAVTAFSRAIRIPLKAGQASGSEGQGGAEGFSSAADKLQAPSVQDKDSMKRFWAFKIGRGLLLSAGEGVNYAFVNRAFGGLRVHGAPHEGRNQQDVDIHEPDELVEGVNLVTGSRRAASVHVGETPEQSAEARHPDSLGTEDVIAARDLHAILHEQGLGIDSEDTEDDQDILMFENDEVVNFDDDEEPLDGDSSDDNDDYENEDDEDVSDDGEEADESDEDPFDPQFVFRSAASRGYHRERVEADVPCGSHTRVFRGHCNVRTVKDVNFFGREDEYVVSGSDSGHLFIWDRKSGALLNVLQGDGEVVNVITGHPYEPMLAVSGIDHTIKIFSPDQRAQTDARRGLNLGINTHRSHGSSSIRPRPRRPGPAAANTGTDISSSLAEAGGASWEDEDIAMERPSNGGLASCRKKGEIYQITNQNDLERQGGVEDAFFTQGMLAHLAAQLRARRMQAASTSGQANSDSGNEDEDGEPIVLQEDCTLM